MHLIKLTIAAFFVMIIVTIPLIPCPSESQEEPAKAPSKNSPNDATLHRPLPEVFTRILPDVKAKSGVLVLLPSELPKPVSDAQHAVVQKTTATRYSIGLFYELDVGDSGFAAMFAGDAAPNYHPGELKNVHEVRLARGIRGFFRPISCGGSCAPVNLWWEDGGVLYTIQLKLSSSVSEKKQQEAITTVANSAILAGPR